MRPGGRDASQLGMELGMRTQRAQRSCAAFRQRGREGLKLGHVGTVNIQTYGLRRYMLKSVGGGEDDYSALLHEEDEEIQNSQHDDQ